MAELERSIKARLLYWYFVGAALFLFGLFSGIALGWAYGVAPVIYGGCCLIAAVTLRSSMQMAFHIGRVDAFDQMLSAAQAGLMKNDDETRSTE